MTVQRTSCCEPWKCQSSLEAIREGKDKGGINLRPRFDRPPPPPAQGQVTAFSIPVQQSIGPDLSEVAHAFGIPPQLVADPAMSNYRTFTAICREIERVFLETARRRALNGLDIDCGCFHLRCTMLEECTINRTTLGDGDGPYHCRDWRCLDCGAEFRSRYVEDYVIGRFDAAPVH